MDLFSLFLKPRRHRARSGARPLPYLGLEKEKTGSDFLIFQIFGILFFRFF